MKKQVVVIFMFILFIISIHPLSAKNTGVNQQLGKIAVIIDSPEFYHASYTDDILNGFNYINQTYSIDVDIIQLTNYTLVNRAPYEITYTYNGSSTNQTQLVEMLIQRNQYDLIVFIGYELRRGFDVSEFPETDFLFYDLSGEFPAFEGGNIPENLFIVNFKDNEQAFLAGSLAVMEFYPLPTKIGIVGTWNGDSRTRYLIAGFQSALFRNTTNVDISIAYVDTWIDQEKVKEISSDFTTQGIELVFTALQANNTLVMLESFTGGDVVSIDLNQSKSVMKNNTRVLTSVFKTFNTSEGFFGGVSASFGITDQIFYSNGWSDPVSANKTLVGIQDEIASGDLVVPTDIKYASNTPSISIVLIILAILPLLSLRKKRR